MLKVKEFIQSTGRVCLGVVHVQYYDLTLRCQCIIFMDRSGYFVKLPIEMNFTTNSRWNSAHWEDKEKSDFFQSEVKKQLAEKYPNECKIPSKDEVKRRNKEFRKRQKEKRKNNPNQGPKSEVMPIKPGKARSQSAFVKRPDPDRFTNSNKNFFGTRKI